MKKEKNQNRCNENKKLTIITQFYPPDYAATGQLIAELASELSKLGVQVDIFTGQPGYVFDQEKKHSPPKYEMVGQVWVQRTRTSRLWPGRIRGRAFNGLFFTLRAGIHLLKPKNRPDVLLLTTEPPYLPILGYIVNFFLHIKYISLIYDIYPDVAVELKVVSQDNWVVVLWKWLNSQVWKRAERIIVLSATMKERVAAQYTGITAKLSVIHSWANPAEIKPMNKEENWFAKEFNLVDKFTVLYSGNLGRCHDLETILRVVAKLKDESINFVFIGHGVKLQFCQAQVKELGITNCQFLPYQDKSVLPYSLTACDLSLVSVERGTEGLVAPSKLYGILAAGKPVAVVCSPGCYLREMLAEAGCGEGFDNGDDEGLANFIRRLAADSELVKSLGNAGRQYLMENFTPEIIAKQYLAVLQ
ncbi:MAG: glycosyltransferase family 4 protein [Gomphosphaeria aponina SAG 52.96 = DSM 107014]|uniref:Glycosyltransferase family 4 protein n=1 Tax=Gomphosphaeria aponina SAG 52.96 = DSM 107014 TaxID=1521640 RepID=A0A941JRK3_9CHRO|nr:glycosyltransferase family 4 protein [Gomphosphaeria aponina SAG 52.96 = DSM 107014]